MSQDIVYNAFLVGANWDDPNNIWHDASEEPQGDNYRQGRQRVKRDGEFRPRGYGKVFGGKSVSENIRQGQRKLA